MGCSLQYKTNIFHYNNLGFALRVLAEVSAEKVTCIHIDMHRARGREGTEKCPRGTVVDWIPVAVVV